MKQVHVVYENTTFDRHEIRDTVLVTTDWDKAEAKIEAIDSRRGVWSSFETLELVE